MSTASKLTEPATQVTAAISSASDSRCLTPDPTTNVKTASLLPVGPSLTLGPNMPVEPRVIRLDIHVFNKDDGSGNYPDNANTRQVFDTTIQWMNEAFLNHHHRSSLPAFTTFVPDSKVRVRLANLFFHNDTAAFNAGLDPTNYLNPGVYFYDNFGTNKQKNLNMFVVAIPGAVGGGVVPGFTPYFFNWKGPSPALTTVDWGMAQLCVHELGHTVGLSHSFIDSLADTPPELVQGWIEPDSLNTSNNLMGYNNTHNFITNMQAQIWHGKLRSGSSSMRDIVQAAPTPRGLVSNTDTGMFSVEKEQDLMRAYWASAAGPGFPPRWNLEIIANAAFKVVPGSLVATNPTTCYGVNDRYGLVKTGPGSVQALEIRSIGGPGITPGSLIDGLTPNTLFAVDLNRHIVKLTAPAGWVNCTTTIVSGATITAGSLLATQMGGAPRVIGVTESYAVVWTTGGTITTIASITAVPGSLVAAGATAVYGVNQNGMLIKVSASLVGSVESPGGLHGGSLLWRPSSSELFGTDPAGNVYRLVSGSGTASAALLPGIPKVFPGSLVDGHANGIFGVLFSGDLVRIYLDSTGNWESQTIAEWNGAVIPGSGFGDPIDGGRYYGINIAGQIIGTWGGAPQINYSIIE
jgi:hypothetical protein